MSVTSPYQPSTGRNGQPAGAGALPGSPPGSGGGDRLPRPPRRRRPGFAALAVLLVVGAAAAAGLLAVRLDERVPILVASRSIQAGAEITTSDLATARVASSDLSLIAASDANAVVGKYATQSIPAGRPLDRAMLTGDSPLVNGRVAVGIPLTNNNMPSGGVKAGDRVKVYAVKDGVGSLITEKAIVHSISTEEKGGTFGGGGGGDRVATVLVVDDDKGQPSTAIAAAAVSGQAALGIAERDAATASAGPDN